MRSLIPLLVAFLHTATAMNNAFARSFALLADMGLNPDGTRIDAPSTDIPPLNKTKKLSIKPSTASLHSASTQPPPEQIEPEYIQLPIDAFAASKNQATSYHGNFFNRYWVSSRAYKPGAPVFLYDVGESDASTNALYRLQDPTSFFRQLVEKYNGIGIVWEHRFYGNSSPTPVDVNTPPEDFAFLTTQQSLADVDAFARRFSLRDRGINATLTPDKTPWVMVGGSYPGMRAAFMRDKYPGTIAAAWASSAPVQAAVDQSSYYEPMWAGLQRYGFGNCSRDIRAAVRWVDGVLDGKNQTEGERVKVMFLGKGAERNGHAAFADALTTVTAAWMSYGVEGGVLGFRRFCDWIETDGDGLKPVVAGAQGWSGIKGAKWVVERWATYPWFVGNVNKYLETECSGRDDVEGKCDLNRKFTDPQMISWTWQFCTQWGELLPKHDLRHRLRVLIDGISGFFQSANVGPHQLVSKYNSLAHWRSICHRQFPTASPDIFPSWPDVARTNRIFGGWSIRPSNTYWSNGEFDPWRSLSRAGGYVIENAQHCYDFRTTGLTVPGGEVSRRIFEEKLTGWLKSWRPRGSGRPGRPWRE